MLDLVLKNGRIADGTGNPWFFGDVGIKDGTIVEVGRVRRRGSEVLDVRGQVISPGFIDGHCHSDLMILEDPRSEIKLRQGVTTEVLGNCGMTPAPFVPENLELLRSYVEPVLGRTEREWSWDTMERYLDSLREAKPSGNFATYVGHGTLRMAVMGFEDRPASTRELGRMGDLLEESLQAGAIGLSLGLMYAPGSYATTDELAQLCSVLPRYDGLLAAHIRGEGKSLIPSIREVLRIAERYGCPLQISHLKAAGRSNWSGVTEAMELVEDARSRGLDVTCDVYPYTAGSTSLTTLLPPWALEGGVSRTLKRLKEPASRQRIKEELGHEHEDWDNLLASTGWDSVYISSLSKGNSTDLEGKNIHEVSESRGLDPADCMMDLLLEQDGKVSMVFFHMAETDVEQVLRWDRSLIASDSLHDQTRKPHPRLYGTFPRILARYVREKKLLSLEEAIRKMTSFPARRFRLGSRGLIAPGYAADAVVFDPEEVSDEATYDDPKRFPKGISHVLVNGTQVVSSGAHLGESAGVAVDVGVGADKAGQPSLGVSPAYEGGMVKQIVMAEKGPAPAGPYSHAVVANGFVFISGQGPIDPETGTMPDAFADQVRQTFENVRTILEAAGSSVDDVVKVNAYITDLTRFAEFNDVYKEFFKNDPPARTTVAAALLGMLVEVDCIATVR